MPAIAVKNALAFSENKLTILLTNPAETVSTSGVWSICSGGSQGKMT